MYLLCLYPHVFEKLRAEVMEKVGPTQMPNFDDIRTMKYLRAVINGEFNLIAEYVNVLEPTLLLETLRLYPIV